MFVGMGANSGGGGYNLESSLRFRSGASAYLSRTQTSGNRRAWTWSAWFKRGTLGVDQKLFGAGNGSANLFGIGVGSGNLLEVFQVNTTTQFNWNSTQVLRDPSAWYHIVVVLDTAQATASNRLQVYLNGSLITANNGSYPSLNFDTWINFSGYEVNLGKAPAQNSIDGYMTEVNFVDGQALTPSDFGETDTTTGVWKPKQYTGTYGTNGFYLPMKETQQATGFNTVIYQGKGGTQSITGVGFSPDLVWTKDRNGTSNHLLYDSVRGATKYLQSSTTNAESTLAGTLDSFDSDGFTLGLYDNSNGSSSISGVAWCWDAGSSTVSNTDGTITSSVRANPATGFSIVTYTVPSGGASFTIGHGLGVAPSMIITKNRGGTSPFPTWFTGFSKDEYVNLNTTAAKASQTDYWGSAVPTSTVFGNKEGVTWNASSNIVSYCFSEVAGFSKFGSYTGNGSTSGPTVTTGFRPAFVMIKRTDTAGLSWVMIDNTRTPYNISNKLLLADSSGAEVTADTIDFDDDGFQLRSTDGSRNASGGTYIYMAFADTRDAQFNFDASGNKNNWTANNINSNASSETTYDIMNDVATLTDEDTANYPVCNPLRGDDFNVTYSNGNMTATLGSSSVTGMGTTNVNLPTTGKWFWEVTIGNRTQWVAIGIRVADSVLSDWLGYTIYDYSVNESGQAKHNDSGTAYSTAPSSGETWGLAFNADDGELTFYKNGVSQGVAFTGLTDEYVPAFSGSAGMTQTLNFGQQPFKYSMPTGYKKLNTYNLPDSAVLDGSQYFDAVTYTGDGGTSNSLSYDFSPDLVWSKSRSNAVSHLLYDSIRGIDKYLVSNNTNGEGTLSPSAITFDSNGHTWTYPYGASNTSGYTYVNWVWRGSDSSPVSNTDGTITSTVSANTTSGFSVVTYTGNGTSGATIGHGLNEKLDLFIIKNRNTTNDWLVRTDVIDGSSDFLSLNTTAAKSDSGVTYANNSVFSLGASNIDNQSGGSFVAYCFHSVEGFSKIGSYTGNGSTDGPFVYTGFRPAFVMYKRTNSTGNWAIHDIARSTYNQMGDYLLANDSAAEVGGSVLAIDALSNGFKIRTTQANQNASGGTYIYMAFAENPFKQSLAR